MLLYKSVCPTTISLVPKLKLVILKTVLLKIISMCILTEQQEAFYIVENIALMKALNAMPFITIQQVV